MENAAGRGGRQTKRIALGGVLLALSIASLYLASFVPGLEITCYTVSSLFIPVMVIEGKEKGGWLLYASCSILSLLILPNKAAAVPYIFFFGIYGLLKYYIERIKSRKVQLAVKFAVFTVIMAGAYFFFYKLFFGNITLIEAPVFVLLAFGEVFFFVYDMILSWGISFYYRRIYGKF